MALGGNKDVTAPGVCDAMYWQILVYETTKVSKQRPC